MKKTDKITKIFRYSGIQPHYFPRLHYFARILAADVFVLRDDCQFVRQHKYPNGKNDKSYQAHSPIKQSFGRQLLSVPVKHGGLLSLSSTKVLYGDRWVADHLKTFQIAYSHAQFFKNIFKELGVVLKKQYASLSELNTATLVWGLLRLLEEDFKEDKLSLKFINKKLKNNNMFRLREIRKASESKALENKGLSTNGKIVALCVEAGANEDYCGGTGVAAYMDDELFKKNGINVIVQDWKGKEYPQLFLKQQGFIPNLSILDLLFNVSSKDARKILIG